jgi:hypothetical protein
METIRLDDPIGSETDYLQDTSLVLDCTHYMALILRAISEGSVRNLSERGLYGSTLLSTVSEYLLYHVSESKHALRMLAYGERIHVPNVEVDPGHLISDTGIEIGRSVLGLPSSKLNEFILSLEPLITRHPLFIHLSISRKFLHSWVKSGSSWSNDLSDNERRDSIVLHAILQEIRTVLLDAYKRGVPAVSNALRNWPTATQELSEDSQVVLNLYFDNAVYSPNPGTIDEALEMRNLPRVTKWRKTMREWADLLSRGELTSKEIVDAVNDANSYIEGAKFAKELLPWWSVMVTLPLGVVTALFPPAVVLTGPLLMAEGVHLYGRLVWASVSADEPLHHGWYVLDSALGST